MQSDLSEEAARNDLIEVCRSAYGRGYISGTEGNFSIRLADNKVLTTPTGSCKGRVQAGELIVTDMNGQPLSAGRPSTELKMHLTAYEVRPDVRAVVHAHPTVAVGFTVAGLSLSKCVLPEVICTLGEIPVAPYATPSTDEVPASIEALLHDHDALILDHHGALTLGATIWDAYYKLETVEHFAQTMLVAHVLGGAKPLLPAQVLKLMNICSTYGIQPPLYKDRLMSAEYCSPEPETLK